MSDEKKNSKTSKDKEVKDKKKKKQDEISEEEQIIRKGNPVTKKVKEKHIKKKNLGPSGQEWDI